MTFHLHVKVINEGDKCREALRARFIIDNALELASVVAFILHSMPDVTYEELSDLEPEIAESWLACASAF